MDPNTAPAVEEITETIYRVPLTLPLRDLHEVNAYAILDPTGLTLVDPGWSSEANEKALVFALRELGTGLDDIARIVVTHSHWDHYTQALTLRERFGHQILLGREEHHTIDDFSLADGVYPRQAELLVRAGAADLAAEIDALELEDWEKDMPFGAPDVWLDGGESIHLGDSTLHAVATPGHTRGHIMFEEAQAGVMFTGDQVLPRVTPSLGFERSPEDLPLRSFLDSLTMLLDHPDRTMLPAHGSVDQGLHERIRELLVHHEQRLKEIHGLALSGIDTAAGIAGSMRWTRHERTLDELGSIHGMTAIIEVASHLDYLVWRGDLTRVNTGSVAHYSG